MLILLSIFWGGLNFSVLHQVTIKDLSGFIPTMLLIDHLPFTMWICECPSHCWKKMVCPTYCPVLFCSDIAITWRHNFFINKHFNELFLLYFYPSNYYIWPLDCISTQLCGRNISSVPTLHDNAFFLICKKVKSLIVTNGSFPLETFCWGHMTAVKIWLPIRIVCLLGIPSRGLFGVIFKHVCAVEKPDVVVFTLGLLTLVGDLDWASMQFPWVLVGTMQSKSVSICRWSA